MVTASKRWALVVGLVLIVLGLAGGTAWLGHPWDRATAPGAPVGFAGAPAIGGTDKPGTSPTGAAPASNSSRPTSNSSRPAPGAVALGSSGAPTSPPPVASITEAPPPAPRFDIVRVEPSGDTVVAGRGEPNARVALLSRGDVVGETTADASGHFVVLPKALTPGDHSLSLRQTTPKGSASTSAQSVTVVVPERGKGSVVVALAEPGQATKVLSDPIAPPREPGSEPPAAPNPGPVAAVQSPAPAQSPVSVPGPFPVQAPSPVQAPASAQAGNPDAKVAVRAVDLEHGDGFHASGAAAPGTPVAIYLNNAHIADVIAGADGQWTVTIKKGLAGGHYVVRADAGPAPKTQAGAQAGKGQTEKGQAEQAQIGTAQAAKPRVTARAEVPFDVPVSSVTPPDARRPGRSDVAVATPAANIPSATTTAATTTTTKTTAGANAGNAGNAVIDEIQTARVVSGDNLWNISLSRLGEATRYTQIYAANEKQIRDPNLIYPGQVFVLPR